MNHETIQKLFSEFSTAYIPIINPEGSGLGLCISNFLVKNLGGSPIKVKSTLGKGSIFRFAIDIFPCALDLKYDCVLPVENEEIAYLDLSEYKTMKSLRELEILIVDDNDFNRIVLGSIFSEYNITYSEATDGQDAINKVLALNKIGKMFKIIIMDCNMPNMDGYESTKIITKSFSNGEINSLPIIIGYSAYSSDEDRKKCFLSGMIDCLTKPCPVEIIMSAVRKYL